MNKAELTEMIAKSADISISKAEKFVGTILNAIKNSLAEGKDVTFVGWGRFGTKARAARTVKNPQTGKDIAVVATHVPYFKAGKTLKEDVDSAAKA